MSTRFVAAVGALGLGLAATAATAQTQTVYATGMFEPANLAFNATGELYSGQFNGVGVFVAPPGGGVGASFAMLPSDVHYAVIGPDNALYVTQFSVGTILRYPPGSAVPDAAPYVSGLPVGLTAHGAIVFDSLGRLYIVLRNQPNLYRVPAGGGAAAVFAAGIGISHMALAVDASDNIYALHGFNGVIQRVTPGGAVSVFSTGNIVDAFSQPQGLAIDAAGNVYVAEYFSSIIFRTGPGGGAASVWFDAPLRGLSALTVRSNVLYAGNYDSGTVYAISLAPPPPPPAGVPTLSEWTMILLALGLAGSAAAVLQRRRATTA